MYFDTTLGLDCLTIVLRTATILSILEGLSDFFFEPTELITLSEDILRTLLFLLTVLFCSLEVEVVHGDKILLECDVELCHNGFAEPCLVLPALLNCLALRFDLLKVLCLFF